MKKKNGFTLVELMAVVIVLIIIILIAINAIRNYTQKANINSIRANAISYIKLLKDKAGEDVIDSEQFDTGIFSVSELDEMGIKLSGKTPDSGYVLLTDYKVIAYCLVYDDYKVVDVDDEKNGVLEGNCDNFYHDMESKLAVFEYDYESASTKTFTAPKDGTYILKVWGAQGGNSHDNNVFGGYGGYSTAYINLSKNDTLYINVGENGKNVPDSTISNSFNGGGACRTNGPTRSCGNGGGASSIALKSGQLSTFSSSLNDIIIVAGGGGGASTHDSDTTTSGGSAGGYIGGSGSSNKWGFGTGGTQSAGGAKATTDTNAQNGSFGLGGNGAPNAGAGGGGGLYGGGGGHGGSGGGGSGYIGNSSLFNAEMYCYNCQTSDEASTKTVSTTCHSQAPTDNCSKEGNGYIKIILLDNLDSD